MRRVVFCSLGALLLSIVGEATAQAATSSWFQRGLVCGGGVCTPPRLTYGTGSPSRMLGRRATRYWSSGFGYPLKRARTASPAIPDTRRALAMMVDDPYQTTNIRDEHPEIIAQCSAYMSDWIQEQRMKGGCIPDPLEEILRERGDKLNSSVQWEHLRSYFGRS